MSLRAFVVRQKLSLRLSQLHRGDESLTPAITWHNLLCRLGVPLPLGLVHDFGLLLSTPASQLRVGLDVPPPPALRETTERYRTLLKTLLAVPSVVDIAANRPSDEVCAVLLAKLLRPLVPDLHSLELATTELSPKALAESALPSPAEQTHELARLARVCTDLVAKSVPLLLRCELLDAQAVRLLHLSEGSTQLLSRASDDRVDLLELESLFDADDLRDTVRFSLDLLPSVLEAQHVSGAQSYPTGGYAGLLHRGGIDALLPSELASDDDLFYTRFALSELLYLGRERQVEAPHPLSYVLVDCSPSMRGLRQVFARGFALSLVQRLLRSKQPVQVRFFDGRLHDALRADRSPRRILPYLLGFRSNRGRNYKRVFSDLVRELSTMTAGNKARVTLFLVTHGECHIQSELVAEVARRARIHAVFVRPSSDLRLDYLAKLHRYHVISDDALHSEATRKQQSLAILQGVTPS
ncbi:MAG TPA: hypothetical protein PKO07_01710 [Pseudomonadota bacterium]|nr:hypothetical protein [Pseudomonadota bacterium]